jgi:hypothetical protein
LGAGSSGSSSTGAASSTPPCGTPVRCCKREPSLLLSLSLRQHNVDAYDAQRTRRRRRCSGRSPARRSGCSCSRRTFTTPTPSSRPSQDASSSSSSPRRWRTTPPAPRYAVVRRSSHQGQLSFWTTWQQLASTPESHLGFSTDFDSPVSTSHTRKRNIP